MASRVNIGHAEFDVRANVRTFRRDLDRAKGTAQTFTRDTTSRFRRFETQIGQSVRRLAFTVGAALSVRAIIQYADAFTQIQNQIRVAVGETSDLAQVTKDLFDIANRTRTGIDSLAAVFQRASLSADELGVSEQQLLGFVETVGQALAVQGTSASQASGALLQLAQALGSGTVRAEEFNSILEGALPIAQAAARGIERTGGSVAKLRQEINAGTVTSKEFFEAIQSQAPQIAKEFDKTQATVGQAMTVLNNALTEFVGSTDASVGGTNRLAQAIIGLADAISDPAFQTFVNDVLGGIVDGATAAVEHIAALKRQFDELRDPGGLRFLEPDVRAFVEAQKELKETEARIKDVEDALERARQGGLSFSEALVGRLGGGATDEAGLLENLKRLQEDRAKIEERINGILDERQRKLAEAPKGQPQIDALRDQIKEVEAEIARAQARFDQFNADGMTEAAQAAQNELAELSETHQGLIDRLQVLEFEGGQAFDNLIKATEEAAGSTGELKKAVDDLGTGAMLGEIRGLDEATLSQQKDALRSLKAAIPDLADEIARLGDEASPAAKEGLEILRRELGALERQIDAASERLREISREHEERRARGGISIMPGTGERVVGEGREVFEERRGEIEDEQAEAMDRAREAAEKLKNEQAEVAANFKEIERAAATVGATLAGIVLDETSIKDAARAVIRSMIGMAIQAALAAAAVSAVRAAMGDASAGASATATAASVASGVGAVVAGSGMSSFQHGGIVSGRRRFLHDGGVGEMGEAGREAIIPMGKPALSTVGKEIGEQMRSEGDKGDLNISVDARGATPGMEQRIEEAVARGVRVANQQMMNDVRRRPGVRQKMGIR